MLVFSWDIPTYATSSTNIKIIPNLEAIVVLEYQIYPSKVILLH